MSDHTSILKFATTAEFLQYILSICDDIDCVEIPLAEELVLTVDNGNQCATNEIYMVLQLMSGEQQLVLKRQAEALLNAGIFHRMRIPIKLIKYRDQ